ncbi:hypothetical protein [Nocardioides bruguierae]|uniref:hypothetical protein n=1 Tax=Nocardioides bruguierae TaxID=2945102 RepID=UPI002020A2DC|nr:hypothetical protein [Nocardioides bruguierae]MCL8025109.1 hypothetical protein [Nocardioides bruguierae]
MTTHDEYLAGLRDRLQQDGCDVSEAELRGGRALLGYRKDFKIQWMGSRLHTMVLALPWDRVDLPALEGFVADAAQWSHLNKKGLYNGLQSGTALFPVLVGNEVTPPAAQAAAAKQRQEFGQVTRPVTVDLSTGTTSMFTGSPVVGFVFNGFLKAKSRAYFG